MDTLKVGNHRREFLKNCGLSTIPFLFSAPYLNAFTIPTDSKTLRENDQAVVNFVYDGLGLSPTQYLNKLQEINQLNKIEPDFYGNGGTTKLLEAKFAKLTGKEKAIYLPSGTMANQLAIKLLNGGNTKVIVPENSHVFRDEADAAQSVHNKRLIPVGEGKPYFSVSDLKSVINYTNDNEVFKSGLGTVVIENPVRRSDGAFVPIETIKEISSYCKAQNYKMHLDGARIHIAAAFTNTSIAEYASYFDTIYISLYKYLNASGGAILCGDAAIIDNVSHQIKILGGTVFQSWNNTSIALHYLEGISERWKQITTSASKLISELNKIEGIDIKTLKTGTNIFHLNLAKEISLEKLAKYLYKQHKIWISRSNNNDIVKLTVNESLLTRPIKEIVGAWKIGVEKAID